MHLILNNTKNNNKNLKLNSTIMNEKIRVNYVSELYRKCLENKPTNMSNLYQSNMPRVKIVNKLLTKKRHLFTKLNCNSNKQNIENRKIQEETDSNYVKKRKQTDDDDDLELEMPTSKRLVTKLKEDYNQVNDIEMDERYLWLIANNYSQPNEWKRISIELGLDVSDLQTIQAKYLANEGLKECFYQCLLKWRLKQPENCYFNYFLNFLRFKLNKPYEEILNLKNMVQSEDDSMKNNAKKILKFYLDYLEQKKQLKSKESNLNTKLDENHLWLASGYIFQEWKSISRCLGLNELDLVSIDIKHMQSDGMRECCYQSLLKWSQYYYEQTSLENLCLCLIQMKLNLYAKQLLEKLCF